MKAQALAIGLMVSVGAHAAAFTFTPGFRIGSWDGSAREFHAVELPPEVHVPPPPAAIARPATPRVSAAPDIAEEATIAPTTWEENPVSSLGPPPRQQTSQGEGQKFEFVPYDVAPRLKNGPEVLALMQKRYPKSLRNAGIEGVVTVWIRLDAEGRPIDVRIRESSGYPSLDAVAREVSLEMIFSPALNRDRPVGVWVAQKVQFEVQ